MKHGKLVFNKHLECMQHTLAEQGKSGPAIPLSFDQLQLGDVAFRLTIVAVPGEPRLDGRFVSLYSSSKALPFWQTTVGNLLSPAIESVSFAVVKHMQEILDQQVGRVECLID